MNIQVSIYYKGSQDHNLSSRGWRMRLAFPDSTLKNRRFPTIAQTAEYILSVTDPKDIKLDFDNNVSPSERDQLNEALGLKKKSWKSFLGKLLKFSK